MWPLLPTHCRWELLLYLITPSDKHTHAHIYSVGFLWMRDWPVVESSTWQHITQEKDNHAPGMTKTFYPSKQVDEDLCLRTWATTTSFSNSNFKMEPHNTTRIPPLMEEVTVKCCVHSEYPFVTDYCHSCSRIKSSTHHAYYSGPHYSKESPGVCEKIYSGSCLRATLALNWYHLRPELSVLLEMQITVYLDTAIEAWDKVQFCQIRDIDRKFQDSLYNSWQYPMSYIAQLTVLLSWEYK